MGSALQRLEILLIGLVVLIAGAVAALLLVLRPPSQPTAQLGTPRPLVTSAPVSEPTGIPALPPTAAPQHPTIAPVSTSLAATPAPTAETAQPSSAVTSSGNALARLALSPIVLANWPWSLLAVGVGGIALVLMRRRRRMTYTNQSVGQLLAAADTTTRTDNLKIMRGLAEQGLLTVELAAAAGIDLPTSPKKRMSKLPRMRLVLPRIALPRLTIPSLHLRAVHFPQLRLPRRTARVVKDMPHRAASVGVVPAHRLAATMLAEMTHPGPDVASLPDVLAMPALEPPETEARNHVPAADAAVPWTAEDRALAVARAVTEVWAEQTARRGTPVQSAVVMLDTSSTSGRAGTVREPPVLVTINGYPDEEALILGLPEQFAARHPTWQTRWRKDRLEVVITADGAPSPIGGPPIMPVLAYGRGGTTIRFFPLAWWRHLGFYGAGALGALHAALASLLFAQPPSDLALAILDNGEVTPLYRDVAHLVSLPGDAHDTIELLAQAQRRSGVGSLDDEARAPRPLVLVVVEPDGALLTRLSGIAARLQARPTTPLHLMIVQERLNPAGRELYALLPGLITNGGQGSAALLPGQGAWPKAGEARLVGRGMRQEGRALGMDEAATAAQLRPLHGRPAGLPAVLWGIAATSVAAPGGASLRIQTDTPELLNASGELHETVPAVELCGPIDELHVASSLGIAHASANGGAPMVQDVLTKPFDTPVDAPAPLTLDGAQAGEQTPLHSRRAALLLATIDAGAAAATPQSLAAPRQNELEAQPPHVSACSAAVAIAPMIEPDNGFPVGPAPLGRVAMADLMTRLVAMPAIVAGQANELGVSKNRLVELLKGTQKAQAKELAEILMVWFDLAGLLMEPTRPGRLRHPRALTTTDLAEIAARLNALSCPDNATVQRMWAESNKGNN
jgi:hypothetical protein